MARAKLSTDIDILLEKSTLVDHSDVASVYSETKLQGPNGTIIDDPDSWKIVHPQAESLKKLFFQSNKKSQIEILDTLSTSLESGGDISRTAALGLIETGNATLLIELIEQKFHSHTQAGYLAILPLLNGYVHFLWTSLTLTQVRQLREWAHRYRKGEGDLGKDSKNTPLAYGWITLHMEAVYNQTTHILAADIEERIDTGYNPEINEDKEELKREVKRFGFPADLSETLDKIDLKFLQAHDAFDFKGCMDLVRAFTERLYRSLLDSYGEDGRRIDEKDSEKVAKFFEAKNLVSDHFAAMLAQQRHFLSDQGSHRIKSREEDARLSKNMVIEMSLYLLRRFENH